MNWTLKLLNLVCLGAILYALFTNHPWFVLGIAIAHQFWLREERKHQERLRSQVALAEVLNKIFGGD